MFCTSCGKEIINTARFCNYCGKPVLNIAPTPISAPIPDPFTTPVPETNAERYASSEDVLSGGVDAFTQNMEDPASDAAEFPETGTAEASMPETDSPISDNSGASVEAAVPANSEAVIPRSTAPQTPTVGTFPTAYPMPNVIPQSGSGVSGVSGTTAATSSKPERERKYTLGHILLCLAATAVMAITAGVFAGLYFSVV